MRVKQLAEKYHSTVDTVRYYTRQGLLTPIKNSNGYKDYTEHDAQRFEFILNARLLGFTVKDIQDIIAESDSGHSVCPKARQIIAARLLETEQQFQQMLQLRNRMRAALDDWQTKPDKKPSANAICHLIDGVHSIKVQ